MHVCTYAVTHTHILVGLALLPQTLRHALQLAIINSNTMPTNALL